MKLNISRLDDGSGIKSTFMRNNAVWHKACRVNFDETRLSRAKLRQDKDNPNDDVPRSKYLRLSTTDGQDVETDTCLFCEKGNNLHSASTFQIDSKVRRATHILQDDKFFRKQLRLNVRASVLCNSTTKERSWSNLKLHLLKTLKSHG